MGLSNEGVIMFQPRNKVGFMFPRLYWPIEMPPLPRVAMNPTDFLESIKDWHMRCGVSVSVTRGALTIFDFAHYPPCLPLRTEPNALASFEDLVDIVQSRLRVMNAFLLCLQSCAITVGQQAMQTMRLYHRDLFNISDDGHGLSGDAVSGLGIAPGIGFSLTQGRLSVIEENVINAAVELLDEILSDQHVSDLDLVSLLHQSLDLHHSHDYSASLMNSWSVCEAIISRLWSTYIREQCTIVHDELGEGRINKIKDRNTNVSTKIKMLALAGRIPVSQFDELEAGRKARNDWIHALRTVSQLPARQTLMAAANLLSSALGVRVEIDLSLSIST